MSREAYCNWSSVHLEVAPSKRQVNIAFIDKGIATSGILVLLQLPIAVIICHLCSKFCYILLFLL
jgi:hypothetical protein